MSTRTAFTAPDAPVPNGNYSHAVKMTPGASTLYVAGWMGDDPETGKIVPGGIEAQTERAIQNILAVLRASGSSPDRVLKRNIYLTDMSLFRTVDAVWAKHFQKPFPVSTCVQVSGLAKEGALVELEVVAEC